MPKRRRGGSADIGKKSRARRGEIQQLEGEVLLQLEGEVLLEPGGEMLCASTTKDLGKCNRRTTHFLRETHQHG